jgi:hypothetical protein
VIVQGVLANLENYMLESVKHFELNVGWSRKLPTYPRAIAESSCIDHHKAVCRGEVARRAAGVTVRLMKLIVARLSGNEKCFDGFQHGAWSPNLIIF